MKGKEPRYDLAEVKRLVREGRYSASKKSTSWLRNHGFSPILARRIILSLQEKVFVKSLKSRRDDGSWADVYCCDYNEDGVSVCLYVKFIVEGDVATVMLMSCKEWGCAW